MKSYRYHLIPVFTDNYVFLIENPISRKCLVVDPGSAPEVISFLRTHQLAVEAVLITHHHDDHIGGLQELISFAETNQNLPVKVYAPEKNRDVIGGASTYVIGGVEFEALGLRWRVLDLPGHTLGHIGYFTDSLNWLFSGDVIFGLGCGRLFEGTPSQQFNSLNQIKKLDPGTKIFCSHEYTERNLAFCKQILWPLSRPAGIISEDFKKYEKTLLQLRSQKVSSVPLLLSDEIKCNPFMLSADVTEFAEIRQLRNKF